MTYLRYGFVKALEQAGLDDAADRVKRAVAAESFEILTEVDIKRAIEASLGGEFRQYRLLSLYNASLAREAIYGESHIGLLLLCNVLLQENPGGGTLISMTDPREVYSLVENDKVKSVAAETGRRLRRAIAALSV